MKECIRIELHKAIVNKWFLLCIAIGCSLSAINIMYNARAVVQCTNQLVGLLSDGYALSNSYEGFSLFRLWIGVNITSISNSIYYLIWPILAAMPYGYSYAKDRCSGYYNQIATRVNRHIYFASKYLALFISGGLTLFIPVTIDLLANALVCPMCIPDVTLSFLPITNITFLSQLYYTYPWIYALLWCAIDFLWGGIAACMCFFVGSRMRFQVMVVLSPFILLVLTDSLLAIICNYLQIKQPFSMLALPQAATATLNPEWAVLWTMGVMTVLTLSVSYWQVVRHELV